MSASTPLLSLKGITKIFPGVRALENVQLDLWPGKVTALIGENGAGKSTLVKVMTGIYQPEEGEILYKAIPIHLPTPESAHKVGITAIHQETVLFDELSVSENIFVGQYLYKGLLKTLDWPAMHRRANEILTRLEVQIDPRATLKTLSIAQRHMVAIARALAFDAQVVILDEPTAALSQHEILEFYHIVERLKQDGKAILFISHKFDEIFELADYYTILRDGVYVSSGAISDITELRPGGRRTHRADAGALRCLAPLLRRDPPERQNHALSPAHRRHPRGHRLRAGRAAETGSDHRPAYRPEHQFTAAQQAQP